MQSNPHPAWITKSGKLIVFGSPDVTSPFVSVTTNPTVYRNGVSETLGSPVVFSQSQDTPFVAYLLHTPALPTDVFTFDVVTGWASNKSGPLTAATNWAVDNYVGKLEGVTGQYGLFAITPTLRPGFNIASQPSNGYVGVFPAENKLYQGNGWTVNGTSQVTYQDDGTPSTWTNPGSTSFSLWLYGPLGTNGVDNMGMPARTGKWLVSWADTTTQPMVFSLSSRYGATVVSDTTINGVRTIIYNIVYPDNPATFEIDVNLHASSPIGQWTAENLWVTAPDPVTGEVTPVPASRFAPDSSMIRVLTSKSGKTPGFLRFMDATGGFGGQNNFILTNDLPNPNANSWKNNKQVSCNFTHARRINSDPSNKTYGWFSNKLYGPQGIFTKSDSFGNYMDLPANSNGNFMLEGGSSNILLLELRSDVPHGIPTGRYINIWDPSNGAVKVPVTNGTPYAPSAGTGPQSSYAYVTGPNTVMITFNVPGITAPANGPSQQVDSTVEIDLTANGTLPGWSVYAQIGSDNGVPYEFPPEFAKALPGSTLQVNLPAMGSDDLWKTIAEKTAAHIGNNNIAIELGNEWWNYGGPAVSFANAMNTLLGYVPEGTVVYDNFVGGNGVPGSEMYPYVVIASGRAKNIFRKVWADAGLDPSRVKLEIGSWWAGSYRTQQIMELAQRWGVDVDYISVAPYVHMAPDTSAVSFCGTAPIDAINDLTRHYIVYNVNFRNYLSQHNKICACAGQPLGPCQVGSANSTDPRAGMIPPGTYNFSISYVDVRGRETTTGLSRSWTITVSAGQVVWMVVPPWPTWAITMNIYVDDGSGNRLYKVMQRSDFDNLLSYGTIILDLPLLPASPDDRRPPVKNLAEACATMPELVSYEGGLDFWIPPGTPNIGPLTHDAMSHASAKEVTYGWHVHCEDGGLKYTAYFDLYGQQNMTWTTWGLLVGTAVVPGDGLNNKFATAQGGAPADGKFHMGGPPGVANEIPAAQGALDWLESIYIPVFSVTNGGFESPVVANYKFTPTDTNWVFTGGAGITANGGGFCYANPAAPEGTQVCFIQGGGSVTQTVRDCLGGIFVIKFKAAQRNYNNSKQDIKVLVDGQVVLQVTPVGTNYLDYTTDVVTLTNGNHVVTFQGLDTVGGDNTILIDDIRVVVPPKVLANTGFETPSVGTSYQYGPANAGWNFVGSAGIAGNNSGWTGVAAPEGTQVCFLQMNGNISQSILGDGGSYVITFQSMQRMNSQQDFAVAVNGVTVGMFKPTSATAYNSFTTNVFTLAAGKMNTITFQGINTAGGDNTAFVDEVALVAHP